MSTMRKVRLILGGAALVVVAAVMVPPFLKDARQKRARDAAFAPVAARLQPLVDRYVRLDLRALAQTKAEPLGRRKALFVDWEKKQLAAFQRDLGNAVVAQTPEEVGLVVYYRAIPDPQPAVRFEGGGRGFGAQLVLVAVTHPERRIVGKLRKAYPAPRATAGVGVMGTTTSVDLIAPIPPEDVYQFVGELTRIPEAS